MILQLSQPIHDLVVALWNDPAAVLIVVSLNMLGFVLQKTPLFPNKFNWLIPWVLYVMGILLSFLIPVTIFPPTEKTPRALIFLIGFIIGVLAYFCHDIVLQYLIRYGSQFLKSLNINRLSPPSAGPDDTKP